LGVSGGPENLFESLDLHDWRQFEQVQLRFHRRLTVLTGANAAGKTTILNLLSSHFGWNPQFVGTPAPRRRRGVLSFLSGLSRRARAEVAQGAQVEIGRVAYSNGGICTLLVPQEIGSAAFQVSMNDRAEVAGIYVPSHRAPLAYQAVTQIPTALPGRSEMLEEYIGEVRTRYTGTAGSHTPAYRIKEALISLATFGYGNKVVEEDPEAIALFEGFIDVLRDVLPPSLGFRELSIRQSEVALVTETGEFSFDAISGGVASIIDLAFQIYMRAQDHSDFVVLIDEPENHLHPELQRSILPGFLQAFPKVQFIVATHNPFVIGSVSDSDVYVLRYVADEAQVGKREGPGQKVSSVVLDTVNKAGTSNQVLRDVLGLEATIPLWVEDELARVVEAYIGTEMTAESVRDLRAEMARLGLGDVFPQALDRILPRDPDK
jgi:predicted ATPase